MTRVTAIGVAAVLTVSASLAILRWQSRDHVLVAGFWFEDEPFAIGGFAPAQGGGPLTVDELRIVEARARAELGAAFAGLRVAMTPARNAMYQVRVVQELAHIPWSPFRRYFSAAGESRVVRPLGGRGAISFRVLADNALAHAPPGATRSIVLEGIGRGLGRAAAHEFAHQFLPWLQIHDSSDRTSYEYASAFRVEQYYGDARWGLAWPHLVDRFGPVAAVGTR